jgi:hypothetical protein
MLIWRSLGLPLASYATKWSPWGVPLYLAFGVSIFKLPQLPRCVQLVGVGRRWRLQQRGQQHDRPRDRDLRRARQAVLGQSSQRVRCTPLGVLGRRWRLQQRGQRRDRPRGRDLRRARLAAVGQDSQHTCCVHLGGVGRRWRLQQRDLPAGPQGEEDENELPPADPQGDAEKHENELPADPRGDADANGEYEERDRLSYDGHRYMPIRTMWTGCATCDCALACMRLDAWKASLGLCEVQSLTYARVGMQGLQDALMAGALHIPFKEGRDPTPCFICRGADVLQGAALSIGATPGQTVMHSALTSHE